MSWTISAVLYPKAVELIKNNWVKDATTATELCFFYEYDGRNRPIRKKVPGGTYAEMVYDVRDRLVFSQNANLLSRGQWLVTFYDDINRPVMTALYATTLTRDQLQTSLNRKYKLVGIV